MADTLPLDQLTAADRCDQCGAQAFVAVKFPRIPHELLFCAHHFSTHEVAIRERKGKVLLDERHKLFPHLPVEQAKKLLASLVSPAAGSQH